MLPAIRMLLEHGGYLTRLECLTLLSNIAALPGQVKYLIDDQKLFTFFIDLIENQDQPQRLRREAVCGLFNITSHRDIEQIVAVASNGSVLRSLIVFLCSNNEQTLTNVKIVQTIVNILEAGDDPNLRYKYGAQPLLPNEYGIHLIH
jgi:hypothetical protein